MRNASFAKELPLLINHVESWKFACVINRVGSQWIDLYLDEYSKCRSKFSNFQFITLSESRKNCAESCAIWGRIVLKSLSIRCSRVGRWWPLIGGVMQRLGLKNEGDDLKSACSGLSQLATLSRMSHLTIDISKWYGQTIACIRFYEKCQRFIHY